MNEAETCRKHVVPALQVAVWEDDPYLITGQRRFAAELDALLPAIPGRAFRGEP